MYIIQLYIYIYIHNMTVHDSMEDKSWVAPNVEDLFHAPEWSSWCTRPWPMHRMASIGLTMRHRVRP